MARKLHGTAQGLEPGHADLHHRSYNIIICMWWLYMDSFDRIDTVVLDHDDVDDGWCAAVATSSNNTSEDSHTSQ